MSLNVDRVWLRTAQGEVLVPVSQIQPGDAVVVRAGGIIPVDGLVLEGEVTVNQASLTGESIPVPKRPGRRGLCRHRGRGGRMCAGGKASLRPEPL